MARSLVTNHTVNVSGVPPTNAATFQAAPRYYELRKTTPGGPYVVYDQATFSPDAGNPNGGLDRWMGSAALDNSGNLAVGYSGSSTTLVPNIRYAGRSAAFLGGLDEGEAVMFPGIGTQAAGSGNRWGDYSGLTVDPVNDCDFGTRTSTTQPAIQHLTGRRRWVDSPSLPVPHLPKEC